MNDLPKTMKWNYRRAQVFMGQVQTDLDLADRMRDELFARIAELEEDKARKAEAISDLVDRVEQVEAASAERDRMLHDAWYQKWRNLQDEDEWLIDLRARTKKTP